MELLLAIAALFVGSLVLNVLLGLMLRGKGTLEWGSILAITLLGTGLFAVWKWTAVVAILAVVVVWDLVGALLDRCGSESLGVVEDQRHGRDG